MGIGSNFKESVMEPIVIDLTVSQLLAGLSKLAPLINGVWAVLSVLLGAAIVGAIWVTKISIAVKNNTAKLDQNGDKLDVSMCDTHREACDRRHDVSFGSLQHELAEIKHSLRTMQDYLINNNRGNNDQSPR